MCPQHNLVFCSKRVSLSFFFFSFFFYQLHPFLTPYQALDTYDEVRRTIGEDRYTLTAAIDVFRRLGDWESALPLLDRLGGLCTNPDRGLRTSTNAVISAMGPDNYRRARELVTRAAEKWGLAGDHVTYGTLLLSASEQLLPLVRLPGSAAPESPSAGSMSGRRTAAEGWLTAGGEGGGGSGQRLAAGETVELLRMAAKANAMPSESCLNMVMFRLARSGAWEEATAFIDAIAAEGLQVSRNQASYGCTVMFVARGGRG